MASVTRNPRDGRWLARWRDPEGRQRKKSFARRIDAQRWLDQLQADQHRGDYVAPAASKVTVAQAAAVWSLSLSHLKPSTRQRYQGVVHTHVVPTWGGRPLGSITHSDVTRWIGDLSESGLRPASVRQVHRVFSLIMDSQVLDGRISRNPASSVRLPRVSRSEPRFLTVDELQRLVTESRSGGFTILFLAMTGLRFGELAALRVRRLDLVRRRASIAESVTEVSGQLAWSTPKTHQTRSVPIPASLIEPLRRLVADGGPDDLVFRSPAGHPLRLTNWRRDVFDPACRRAGIDRATPHDLRHTAASFAIASGANVKAVQRMLGHASAAMTLDVYAGLFPDDLDAVAVSLDAYVPQMCHSLLREPLSKESTSAKNPL